jgi:hypothetical protein
MRIITGGGKIGRDEKAAAKPEAEIITSTIDPGRRRQRVRLRQIEWAPFGGQY